MLLVHVVSLWRRAVETAQADTPPALVPLTPRPLICLYSNKPCFEFETTLRCGTTENVLLQLPNSLCGTDGPRAAR